MTIGEKIQFYREIRGLSQTALAELSDVSINTLRKYENNTRNPKPEQVQKIANALQISIHALIDIDIKSIDDIAPYLFEIAKIGGVEFCGEKDASGKYIKNSITLQFKSDVLKIFIKEWADKQEVINKLRNDAKNSPDEQAKEYLLKRADEIEQEIHLRIIDSPRMIDNSKGISVRIYPTNN